MLRVGSTEFSVAISRIPGQPAVLYSGAEVTLLCLITYNGNSSLQAAWYNGTQTLEGDDNVQLTAPYLVLGDVYVAAAHVSVLVSHTSSYRCDIISDQVSISESLQLKVTNSGIGIKYKYFVLLAYGMYVCTVGTVLGLDKICFFAYFPFYAQ